MIINDWISQDLKMGSSLHEQYVKAEPFPHIILDNFLKNNKAELLLQQYPAINEHWLEYETSFERKRAIDDIEKMPESHATLLLLMNSGPVLNFLENITGIKGLIPDAHFRGGGLHQITTGGKLDVHIDRQIHPATGLYRRLNLLIYFNKYYKPEFKGELELWDPEMTKCIQKIEPRFNRCVIFTTNGVSAHGHPEAWLGRDTRKSMALYYWTKDYPKDESLNEVSTKFLKRPQDETTEEIEAERVARSMLRLK